VSAIAAIRTKLLADANVIALTGTRIHIGVTPSGKGWPRVTMNRIGLDGIHTMAGSTGFAEMNLQIDCWAKKQNSAHTIAETIRKSLDTYNGTLSTIYFNLIRWLRTVDTHEPESLGKQNSIHRARLDFTVWHAQSAPSP